MREAAALAVHTFEDAEVTPRPARATDVTKLTLPLPFTITLIGLALAAAAGVWRIESKVAAFETALSYERQLDAERSKTLDSRFAALEAKIESAGLRNAAMAMSQELDKRNAERKR